ncbi:MAG: Mut7-C RNAse domain-containing protein [Leptolyngbyaceae cyanobacterium MO_188.B28]|nr:Mut7-C RNAse domain-containing protein [Leptolyngbyaceae cyanobacterium MO_188.B28]
MLQVYFRFYGDLNDFLPAVKRQTRFVHFLKEPASIKDVIESLGPPHPEVDLILVNGASVDFNYLLRGGENVSVYPLFRSLNIAPISQVRPPSLTEARFVLDVHLGKLAIYLRLLGFDGLYQNNYSDPQLAELAHRDRRILLTQDRALLKRSIIRYGYCVRASDPMQQLQEVLRRFQLFDAIAPFQRCLRCNGRLKPVEKAEICDRLEPLTQKYYTEFRICQDCQQIYWKGSHYERMQTLIDGVLKTKPLES